MKFRTKIFDPSCTSVMTLMDAHKLIGKTDGLNEQPCLKAKVGWSCSCCLQFEISGMLDSDDCAALNQIVMLVPIPVGSDLYENRHCVWIETQASTALRGMGGPLLTPGYFQYAAGVNSISGLFTVQHGDGAFGPNSFWAASVGAPCLESSIEVTWRDNSIDPFYFCPDSNQNLTLTVTPVNCRECISGICVYDNQGPDGPYTWQLINSNCPGKDCTSGDCGCPSIADVSARWGNPTSPFEHRTAYMSCRCD